jgi:hypothetical protein
MNEEAQGYWGLLHQTQTNKQTGAKNNMKRNNDSQRTDNYGS